MAYSLACSPRSVTVVPRARLLALLPFGTLGERDGVRLELGGETRLVTGLEHARLAEQRAHGVARQRADVEPVVGPVGLDVQRVLRRTGRVLADDLDELAVARALGIGDDDAVRRSLLAADAAEANANCHGTLPDWSSVLLPSSSRIRRIRTALGVTARDEARGERDEAPATAGAATSCLFPRSSSLALLPHAEHARRHPAAGALRDLLHHLLHVAELLEQPVHLVDRATRLLRDPRPPRAVDDLRLAPLLERHREDDRLEVLHALGLDLRLLEHLGVHAREHLQDPLERAQLLDLLHRDEEVAEVHAVLADLLLQLLRLGLVERALRLLDEAEDVALLEDA